jgi:hypothetical protein
MTVSCKGSLAKLADHVRVMRLRDEQEGQERLFICRRHGKKGAMGARGRGAECIEV